MSTKPIMSKPTSAGAVCAKLEEKLRKLRAQHEFTVRNYSDQIATLKTELENERHATRNLTRSHKADVKAVREEEQKKCQNLVEQIRAQLNLKFKEELEKEKKRLTEKYQLKKTPSTSTASRISRIFKVGDTTASKSKTSHVKELVRRLNGLQTGPSGTAPGKSFKCVTKTPSNSSHQMPRDLSSLSGVSEVQSSSSKQESSGVDTDSVTEEPIVPQIIVPNQDCELENRLPDDSLTEDGVMEDRNSVINSWTKGVGVETLYTLLSSAHLELQRAHLILQSNLRKEQRTRKHLEEKVRYLNSIILSQKSKTNILINPINSSLSQQLEACKEREGKLLEQLQELNDQNELLEFRVLELEQCTGVGSEHTLAKVRYAFVFNNKTRI
ncbi:uncharacterized protein LOC103515387 isoform X2 [Diaphorina citri]|uniref:Uncharacterized protein LOC103515387 isoform X2 n=1 Tax=Diaphorina citri TaxID=121845 RepID=A0A1S4EJ00_DIACI|nr:uncharacterized protein LOC103515387 isoform X2 [Diaphorina citri]